MPGKHQTITPLLLNKLKRVRGIAGRKMKPAALAWCARLQTVFADKAAFEAAAAQDESLRTLLLNGGEAPLAVWRANPRLAGANGRIFLAEPPALRWKFNEAHPVNIHNRLPSSDWPFTPGSQVYYWGVTDTLKQGFVKHYNPARKVDAASDWLTVEGHKLLSIESNGRTDLVWLEDVAMPNAHGIMKLARKKTDELRKRVDAERAAHNRLIRELREAAEFYGQIAKTGKLP